MALRLDTQQLLAIDRATTALLSPLDFESAELWRRAVVRELKKLLGADIATFLLPSETGPWVYSEEADPRGVSEYAHRMPRLPGGLSIWERQLGMPVWDRAGLYGDLLGPYLKSEYYNDFVVPVRAFDAIGLSVPYGGERAPGRFAGLMFHHDTDKGPRFGQEGLALLGIFRSSLVAGVDTYRRLGPHREALSRVVDATGEAILLLGPAGVELHRTPRLEAILQEDQPASAILAGMHRLAGGLGAGDGRRLRGAGCTTDIVTAGGRYRATLALIEHVAPGTGKVTMVTLSRVGPKLPTIADVRERFGLTKRQAAVALLLCEGRSNDEIARTLFISVHTARHHTEQVLLKLGAKSRGEAAARLADRLLV